MERASCGYSSTYRLSKSGSCFRFSWHALIFACAAASAVGSTVSQFFSAVDRFFPATGEFTACVVPLRNDCWAGVVDALPGNIGFVLRGLLCTLLRLVWLAMQYTSSEMNPCHINVTWCCRLSQSCTFGWSLCLLQWRLCRIPQQKWR